MRNLENTKIDLFMSENLKEQENTKENKLSYIVYHKF